MRGDHYRTGNASEKFICGYQLSSCTSTGIVSAGGTSRMVPLSVCHNSAGFPQKNGAQACNKSFQSVERPQCVCPAEMLKLDSLTVHGGLLCVAKCHSISHISPQTSG
jgi:hypothetical protein